jgi:hypothetical protein
LQDVHATSAETPTHGIALFLRTQEVMHPTVNAVKADAETSTDNATAKQNGSLIWAFLATVH